MFKKVTCGFCFWGSVIEEACKKKSPHSGGIKKQHTLRDFNNCQRRTTDSYRQRTWQAY